MWACSSTISMLKQTRSLAILGTSSGVGKSLVATALCRILKNKGYCVAPFKAINISLNAGVTKDGKEMAVAQVIQAEACGITPESVMNPFLIKPQKGNYPQVIINGEMATPTQVEKQYKSQEGLWTTVKKSFEKLKKKYDVVVIEGAAALAEPGFIKHDMANLRIAKYARSAIILVGDIERGGVFASLEGTISILKRYDPEGASFIRGIIINKYLGERKHLSMAIKGVEKITGVPVLGVIPYIESHGIPDEDTWFLKKTQEKLGAMLDVVVLQTPSIQNTQDFDFLVADPALQVRFVAEPENFANPDLVILGGSKSTISDLAWLRRKGLAKLVLEHARRGKAIIGICGGFQMLGRTVLDPKKFESRKTKIKGLNLLPVTTIFEDKKITRQVKTVVEFNKGLLKGAKGLVISGYEIHMGRSIREVRGLLTTDKTGWIIGTYVHDIFKNEEIRGVILENLAKQKRVKLPKSKKSSIDPYNAIAEEVGKNVNMQAIYNILNSS